MDMTAVACEALARQLGLGQRVRFHGWLPRKRIDDFYRAADVFVFPSYREPGGNVTFEAMGHSLPLVVSDRGGPGAVVDETCGIRVHPDSPGQYAQELASALARLVREPAVRLALGEGARRRAREVGLWESQGPPGRAGLRGRPGAGCGLQRLRARARGGPCCPRRCLTMRHPERGRRNPPRAPSSRRAGRTWC